MILDIIDVHTHDLDAKPKMQQFNNEIGTEIQMHTTMTCKIYASAYAMFRSSTGTTSLALCDLITNRRDQDG